MGDVGYLDPEGRFWFCGRMAHHVLTAEGPMYSVRCEAIFNYDDVEIADELLWAGVPSALSQLWHNSTFDADGNLKQAYLDRLTQILDKADDLGMVVILGLFYQGQDERLRDETAVRHAINEACGWVLEQGYTNAVIEINNECDTRYEHAFLQPERVHEAIALGKAVTRNGKRLLVGTSYGGGGRIPSEAVAEAVLGPPVR